MTDRFRRRWHATLRQLVTDGHLPRPLSDEERHRAQLAILGAQSLADAPPERVAAVDARLSAAAPQAIAWALWLHGVLGGGGYEVEERIAIKIHDGGMTEEQARATLIIETS